MVKYKYIGNKWDGSPPGYPARDVTEADIKERGLDVKILDGSPLYEKVGVKKADKKAGE